MKSSFLVSLIAICWLANSANSANAQFSQAIKNVEQAESARKRALKKSNEARRKIRIEKWRDRDKGVEIGRAISETQQLAARASRAKWIFSGSSPMKSYEKQIAKQLTESDETKELVFGTIDRLMKRQPIECLELFKAFKDYTRELESKQPKLNSRTAPPEYRFFSQIIVLKVLDEESAVVFRQGDSVSKQYILLTDTAEIESNQVVTLDQFMDVSTRKDYPILAGSVLFYDNPDGIFGDPELVSLRFDLVDAKGIAVAVGVEAKSIAELKKMRIETERLRNQVDHFWQSDRERILGLTITTRRGKTKFGIFKSYESGKLRLSRGGSTISIKSSEMDKESRLETQRFKRVTEKMDTLQKRSRRVNN